MKCDQKFLILLTPNFWMVVYATSQLQYIG